MNMYMNACFYTDPVATGEHDEIEMNVGDARTEFSAAVNAATKDGQITYVMNRNRRVALIGPLSLAASEGPLVDQLERLYALFERGALTDAEYQRAKGLLLGEG
jgi:antitoxin (DNA-binding transcriptional repressor) of toxin-antitoxin stability system